VQNAGSLLPSFRDPVHDAQDTFRRVMGAFSCPATVHDFPSIVTGPEGLNPVTSAVLLALADSDTPIWIDPLVGDAEPIANYLGFYTGARFASEPDAAVFVVVNGSQDPDLSKFPTGTLEYPDRSATIIVQVDQIMAAGMRFEGPGLKCPVMLSAFPLWTSFEDDWKWNRGLFPRGLDVVLTAPSQLAALPRSLRLCGGL
jgi:alpha-D-ribose 1-methylphosphonate 5-triphosphate synthase subunit PhnH